MTCGPPRELPVAIFAALTVLLEVACSSQQPAPAATMRDLPARIAQPIPEVVQDSRSSRPVFFIGLDGADWRALEGYMASGVMPNLRQLVEEGTAGTLETLHPPLSPIVWTTMMTGVDPLHHRILDFVRFNPTSGQKEPITSDERRAPAIWNMASWGGRRVGVFGLWATYPAEPVNGVLVSDRLFTFLFKEAQTPEGVVFPFEKETWAKRVVQRVNAEVHFAELRKYLPWLTAAEYEASASTEDPYAHPVSALRRILVETRIYDTLAREWMLENRPDVAIVYLQGTDSIGHAFAPFAAPRQPAVSAADYERYRSVPERYFSEIDGVLGRYRDIARQHGATLMLASDHGFAWGDDRPTQLSSNAQATAAKWHHKQGIYVLWGPGIAARGRDPSATGGVGQVCPTLLALSGLPALSEDRVGPLPGAPRGGAKPIDYGAFYHPSRPAKTSESTRAVDEDALQKLRSLGYIGGSDSDRARRLVDVTRSAGSYNNEGLVLKSQGRKKEAAAAFENALIVDPNLASALWNLSDLLFESSAAWDRSDTLLVHAFAAGLPEGTKFLVGRAIGYERAGQLSRSVQLLTRAVAARPQEPDPWLFLGRYHVETGDCRNAVHDFEQATRLAPQDAKAFASLGLARLCAGDRTAARRDLQRSLELDPRQAPVREYLKKLGA